MQKVKLGRTDLEISKYTLGTMTFGVQTSQADAFQQMDMAMEAGINSFDTAELYPVLPISAETQGESERIIGRWMKERGTRDQINVLTKIAGINNNSARDGSPINKKALETSLERSLQNLQTDCVELYQLHWPNRGHYHFRRYWNYDVDPSDTAQVIDDLRESIEGLEALKKAGKIKAYGVSNETAWGIMKMLEIGEAEGLIRCSSVQNEYSIMHRIFEPDLQEVCLREDVGLLTYSSLAGGLMTGKYGKNGEIIPEGSRRSIEDHIGGRVRKEMWPILNAYIDLAKDSDIDPTHFAYRFCLSQNFVASVIIGATHAAQLEHILAGETKGLSSDILRKVDEIRREYPVPL